MELSDGRVIEVRAAPEALYEITAKDSRHLLALAWQIGNRHLAAQIETGRRETGQAARDGADHHTAA